MKTRGTDADTGGVHFQADPHMHPGILQLAEVGCFLGGGGGVLLLQRYFQSNSRRRNLCLLLGILKYLVVLDEGMKSNQLLFVS